MRLIVTVIGLLGAFVLFGMLVAPYQAPLRDWYLQYPCPYLDQLSTDICAAARREAGQNPVPTSR